MRSDLYNHSNMMGHFYNQNRSINYYSYTEKEIIAINNLVFMARSKRVLTYHIKNDPLININNMICSQKKKEKIEALSDKNEDESFNPKPFKCCKRKCGKSYKNRNGLEYHIKHYHNK